MIEIMWVTAAVGQCQPRCLSASSPSYALDIVKRLRGHVAEEYSFQIA